MELTNKGMSRAILALTFLAAASCGSDEEDEAPVAPRDAGAATLPSDGGSRTDAGGSGGSRDAGTDDPSADDAGEDIIDEEDAGDGEDGEDDAGDAPVDAGDGGGGGGRDSGTDSGGGDSGPYVPDPARGEVLAIDNNCASCHGLNYAGFAAGTAIAYPNITPHVATGIGSWTDEEIASAINLGEAPDGDLCILMARYGFEKNDTADLIAFLRGLTPVSKVIADVCQ